MMNIEQYFQEKILKFFKIEGHYNKNFKVYTEKGTFHLKILSDNSYQIKKWIEGDTIKVWNEDAVKKVCKELMKLHSLSKNWKIMDYQITTINNSQYSKIVNQYKGYELVPCHNDLNKDNIIMTSNQVQFIDFEFNRLNYKYWDIANILNEDRLGSKEKNWFLKHYQGLKSQALDDFIYINKVFNQYWIKKHMKP